MIMANKKQENPLTKMTYAQLEEEASSVLEKLNDTSLPLDEATKIYQYGKDIYAEMEKRLAELQKSVTDTIK